MGWWTDTKNFMGDLVTGGAQSQLRGQREGRNALMAGAEESKDYLTQGFQGAQGYQQPYYQSGVNALNQMQDQSQFDYGQFNPESFSAPGAEGMYADPGYQFRMQQGNQAMLGSLAKGAGGAYSPDAMRRMMQYNQGLGSQEYQNVFDRAKTGYDLNYNRAKDIYGANRTNLADKWNRLESMRNSGQTAAGNLSNLQSDYAANMSNVNMQGRGAQAQSAVNQANIRGGIPGYWMEQGGKAIGTAAQLAPYMV